MQPWFLFSFVDVFFGGGTCHGQEVVSSSLASHLGQWLDWLTSCEMDLVWIKLMRGNKLTKNPLHQWLVDSFHGEYFYNTLPKTNSEFGTIPTFFYGGGELANSPQLSHSCLIQAECVRVPLRAKCKDHISLVVIEKAHCRCQNQHQTPNDRDKPRNNNWRCKKRLIPNISPKL